MARVGNWCVLRTSARGTLGLLRTLSDAGFDVWTPVEVQHRRVPRSKERREVELPMMPTFVFARADRMHDLFNLSRRPGRDHVGFSVMRYHGTIPILADRDIQPLRVAEKRVAPKDRIKTFRRGERVRVPEGSFGGMSGIVEQSDGRFTLVCFGRYGVTIETFLLESDVQHTEQPIVGTAAEAALVS